ncbi:MOB kinase activator 2-like [Anguilla rostrata]|uniref:MOB kinase activator 2-like n=1 Tax=Anguilla anguilla TaxID=7936 RepID=UPI0015B1407D|nr:MOB kinase activator 2-like [Anguilla anguilla]
MGGCHSYGRTRKAVPSKKRVEFSDVDAHKLKNNNTQTVPYLVEKPYLLQGYVSEGIADMDIETLSALPVGLDEAEWMATNTIAFFKNINLFSGAVSEFCTTKTCPTTRGPGDVTYYWSDEQGKKVRCSAPLYTDYTMSYIHELLTDEDVFPTGAGTAFPKGHVFLVQRIFQYLFRTLAHLYWAHFRDVVRMDMHPHLNTLFAHFVTFGREFRLLEPAETAPLEDLISALCSHHRF